MRIRRYPGKAVDASLSLEQSNAMETIYKNNWLNAHETIRSNGTAFGNDYHQPMGHSPVGFESAGDGYSNGVSSLGKYQMTLEQIRQLELKNKDPSVTQAIKDLSGYKPSTLRRKNRRHYPGWDELIDEQNVADHLDEQANGKVYNYSQFDIMEQSEPVKNISKSRQHKGSTKNAEDRQQRPANRNNKMAESPTYENLASIKIEAKAQSKLKRSQTLKESSAASFCSTLDIKDIFRRCPQSKVDHCDKDLSRRNASSSSSGNSSANSSTKSSTDMTTALMVQPNRISYNCDRNSRTISIEPTYSQGRTVIEPENAPNRMSISYNADPILTPAQKSKSIVRAKSVRIQNQSFTTEWDESPIMSAPRPSKPPPSPPIRRNASSSSSSSRQESPTNNKFNTVSATGTRQRNNNLPTSILVTTASASVPTITTTTPVPAIKPILKHVQIVDRADRQSRQTGNQTSVVANTATVQPRRKPASSSSVDSDEMFSIPRPRLIVPVHTYARKRRTGNLLSAQADDINDDDDEVRDSGKGELNLFSRHIQLNMVGW